MTERLYYRTLLKLLNEGQINIKDSILVVCGGFLDREVLLSLGFSSATITNVDSKYDNRLAPYDWKYANVESLDFEDNSFDWVIVHAGLHHCYSPHKGLLEMLRVSSLGVLVFESRDSLTIRFACHLGFVSVYELEAVVGNNYTHGGVNNGPIPNFIYRWTEREVRKIVSSYYPQFSDNSINFFYNLRLPIKRLSNRTSLFKYWSIRLLSPLLGLFFKIFYRQSNEFGFMIRPGLTLHPWLSESKDGLSFKKKLI